MLGYGITTPKILNEEILNFCKEINSENSRFLDVASLSVNNARPSFCYENVKVATDQKLGEEQLGWVIWIDPQDRFLKAEAHSVLKTPEGNLIDVTPQQDGELKILFLPDNTLVNDGTVISSIYKALVADRKVLNYIKKEIKHEEEYKKDYEKNNGKIKMDFRSLMSSFPSFPLKAKEKIGRNELCPCGSGKKYKKCCLNK